MSHEHRCTAVRCAGAHRWYGRMLAAGLTAMTVAAAGADAQIAVGPNVHVSAARAHQAHGEVLLGADPTDPDRLLGCSMVISDEAPVTRWTTVYASADGGRSWRPTLETDERAHSGDPSCVFGSGGAAYFTDMAWPDHDDQLRYEVYAYRSRDGGNTWSEPTVVGRRFDHLDREFVVVDNSPTSPYRGRVYVHAHGSVRYLSSQRTTAALKLYRSLDGGATFLGPMERASDGAAYIFGSGSNVVLADGTVAIVFPEIKEYWKSDGTGEWLTGTSDRPNMEIKVVTSSDGGESLNPAATVSDQVSTKDRADAGVPYIAADLGSSLFKDRLYVVWHDERSGRSEIYLAYSTDKGKLWSPPRRVNDDGPSAAPEGPDHFMPVVAVNQDGVVGVSWYDRRAQPDNLGWEVRFAASLDGGDTFLPSLRVSSAAVWTFRSADTGGRLVPKGVTEPQELRFRYTKLLPLRKEKDFRSSALQMDLRVLGRLK